MNSNCAMQGPSLIVSDQVTPPLAEAGKCRRYCRRRRRDGCPAERARVVVGMNPEADVGDASRAAGNQTAFQTRSRSERRCRRRRSTATFRL